MNFLNFFVLMLEAMRPLWSYAFNYIFALAFLASVPCIIRKIWRP